MDLKLQRRRPLRVSGMEAGFSLIELMIAMIVLVVGMMAIMVMISTAIASNNRNKLDTTATALSQMVAETVASQSIVIGTPITVRDCNPTAAAGPQVWTIATLGAVAPGAGANLNADGNIDFTQTYAAVPANYKMRFVTCGSGGRQATYDVRWNVRTISAFSKMVTVSARLSRVTAAGGAPADQLT
ncbi:MAG: type IV pilus modification PilV family protein, partial [Terriglobales bacterium]